MPQLNATNPPDCSVFIVRLTAHVGVVLVVGGLLPLRMTSATDPFSTIGPSGESDHLLSELVVHAPCGGGLIGTVDQYVLESVVQ